MTSKTQDPCQLRGTEIEQNIVHPNVQIMVTVGAKEWKWKDLYVKFDSSCFCDIHPYQAKQYDIAEDKMLSGNIRLYSHRNSPMD